MELVPKDHWTNWSHWLIWHGRRRCYARKPDCANCEVFKLCPSGKIFFADRSRAQTRRLTKSSALFFRLSVARLLGSIALRFGAQAFELLFQFAQFLVREIFQIHQLVPSFL